MIKIKHGMNATYANVRVLFQLLECGEGVHTRMYQDVQRMTADAYTKRRRGETKWLHVQ